MLHTLFAEIFRNELFDTKKFEKNVIDILVDSHCKAYYKGNFILGRKIGCYLIENANVSHDIKHAVKHNQLFYLNVLGKLREGEIHVLSEPLFLLDNPKDEHSGEMYKTLNPSIYNDNGDIYVNVRHVSFSGINYKPSSKDEIIKTKNTFGRLKNNKLESDYKEILDRATYLRVDNRVLGFEDMKIFKKNSKWCFTCTSYEASKSTLVLYGELDDEPVGKYWETHNVWPLKGDMVKEHIPEKNWMPIITDKEDIDFLYSTFPLHVVRLNKETKQVETIVKKKWSRNLGKWRGSSCLVPYKDGYIYLIHEVYFINGLRNYVHRLVWIKEDYTFLKYSDPFFLERNNKIEYCNGIAFKEGKFYITYGDGDSVAKMMVLPEEIVSQLIENFLH